MEKQEKKTKVSGVYLVLAALTVLFAVSLVFLHKTAYEGASHGNYTVTTQDKTAHARCDACERQYRDGGGA